jgi:small basic protein
VSISVTDPRTLVGGSVMDFNVLAIVAGAIVAFLLSGAWYGVLGGQLAQLHEAYARQSHPAATTMVVELVRNAVVAVVIAGLADQIGIDALSAAVVLALVLWVAFPVVLLTGSIFHEHVPPRLAVIHAGDWLMKLLAITAIVAVWQ